MSRLHLVTGISSTALIIGCSALASIAAPSIKSVTVYAPAGLLVGDSAFATADAFGDDGKTHNGRPRTWSSSDAAALSIDDNGKMIARIAGRTVTITAEVEGTKGTATVAIASDDSRFGYALADQPSAAGPYSPDVGTRFNSAGGSVSIARSAVGVYAVRFEGLGRAPGQRDNVQVSAYNSAAVYCKIDSWIATLPDLVVNTSCHTSNGTLTDSKFSVLVVGAWAFGKTASLMFAVPSGDSGNFILDTAATTRSSVGGSVVVGAYAEGKTSMNYNGFASAWASSPLVFMTTALGANQRRCETAYFDRTLPGAEIDCYRPGGGAGSASFSVLALQQGRSGKRFGAAMANKQSTTTDYAPPPEWLSNSSGGTVLARKTALGEYRVVFAGLGRPTGGSEIVLVHAFLWPFAMCTLSNWGNTGVNDLFVTASCFNPAGVPVDAWFSVVVLQ